MTEVISLRNIAKMIDHSLLHPMMTDEVIQAGCLLAKKLDVATACVKPYSVNKAQEILAGTDVLVCSVIGFPHGNSKIDLKIRETQEAIQDGAHEIDMVVNIGKVLSEAWNYVSDEIKEINEAVVNNGAILKVIFETDFLEDFHIIRLCEICSQIKVAFVKTSTGYGFVRQENGSYTYLGATDHNVRLMREHCLPSIQVKASGGVRNLDDLLHYKSLGVTRIGATATETILGEARKRGYQ